MQTRDGQPRNSKCGSPAAYSACDSQPSLGSSAIGPTGRGRQATFQARRAVPPSLKLRPHLFLEIARTWRLRELCSGRSVAGLVRPRTSLAPNKRPRPLPMESGRLYRQVSTFRRFDVYFTHTPPNSPAASQVEDADGAVAVEVRRAAGVGAPGREKRQQVEDADGAIRQIVYNHRPHAPSRMLRSSTPHTRRWLSRPSRRAACGPYPWSARPIQRRTWLTPSPTTSH